MLQPIRVAGTLILNRAILCRPPFCHCMSQSFTQDRPSQQWLKQGIIGCLVVLCLTFVTPLGGNGVAIAQTLDASSFTNLSRLDGEATVELMVKGEPITIEVKGNEAPITAGNFVELVNSGFYDGLSFHRVVRSPRPFVVQGGDPQSKDPDFPPERLGTAGYTDPATGQERNIPLEILPRRSDATLYGRTFDMAGVTARPVLNHTRGAVAMARSQSPNSGSSQFYITLADQGFLDGKYAVFGYVTEGMDVVDNILQGDRIDSAVVTEGLDNLVSPES